MQSVSLIVQVLLGGVLLHQCTGNANAATSPGVYIQQVRLLDYKIARTKAFITSKGESDSCYGIFILIDAADFTGEKYTALGDVLPRGLVTNETDADAWTGARRWLPIYPAKRSWVTIAMEI